MKNPVRIFYNGEQVGGFEVQDIPVEVTALVTVADDSVYIHLEGWQEGENEE